MYNGKQIDEFILYLEGCNDRQVEGVWQKEVKAGRWCMAGLAMAEARSRGIMIDTRVLDGRTQEEEE